MGRPPDRSLYGDDVGPLGYWEQESPRISTTEISPLASVELGHSSLPRQMRRCRSLCGRYTSNMVVARAHMGFPMVLGGMALIVGIKGCMDLCHEVQCYVEEYNCTYLCAAEQDDAQQVVRVLPRKRYLTRASGTPLGLAHSDLENELIKRPTMSFHLSHSPALYTNTGDLDIIC